jgi:hypothetical protein
MQILYLGNNHYPALKEFDSVLLTTPLIFTPWGSIEIQRSNSLLYPKVNIFGCVSQWLKGIKILMHKIL